MKKSFEVKNLRKALSLLRNINENSNEPEPITNIEATKDRKYQTVSLWLFNRNANCTQTVCRRRHALPRATREPGEIPKRNTAVIDANPPLVLTFLCALALLFLSARLHLAALWSLCIFFSGGIGFYFVLFFFFFLPIQVYFLFWGLFFLYASTIKFDFFLFLLLSIVVI